MTGNTYKPHGADAIGPSVVLVENVELVVDDDDVVVVVIKTLVVNDEVDVVLFGRDPGQVLVCTHVP